MALTGLYGKIDPRDARAVINSAVDMGFRLFDTAPLYTDGENERLLGCTLAGHKHCLIATKFGLEAGTDGTLRPNSRPDAIRVSVDASLRRLNSERIDLLFQHRPDPQVDDAEVAGMIKLLIAEGKVDRFGLSRSGASRAGEVARNVAIACVQNAFSPLSDDLDVDEAPTSFTERGMAFLAYSPLARGAVVRPRRIYADDDYRQRSAATDEAPEFSKARDQIEALAQENGTSLAGAALAWVREQDAGIVALPGPRTVDHVSELTSTSLDTF